MRHRMQQGDAAFRRAGAAARHLPRAEQFGPCGPGRMIRRVGPPHGRGFAAGAGRLPARGELTGEGGLFAPVGTAQDGFGLFGKRGGQSA